MRTFLRLIAVALFSLWLAGCDQDPTQRTSAEPIAFHSDDECHVCGMIITNWPGPKGEILAGTDEVYKFCSTVDMLSWWLQPENNNRAADIYVHDMTSTPWDSPEDEHLINATEAWYVMGSSQMGMGPTLASFSSQEAANDFSEQYNGEVLAWADLDLEVLQKVMHSGHSFSLDAEPEHAHH
ncbi:nitrous oxide reductase accessory protein NosL [Oceanisphaera avium]|uniref:Nitrous oxide reductase accessory protein NosL n=1 Tax=Oceanisphaera avium TaxID=1903694 RepID=A0A1Y0CZD7_9GAMM|nr:nitrous oxide reductase accessory protein NosL [Oceanisphaera avium]ART80692.1 hypothetical protein CBP12_11490 [Oceanisphaera avium]